MKENILVLFTLNFPYDKGEEFIENEIKEAIKHFSKIYILPNTKSEKIRSLPTNVKIVLWDELNSEVPQPNIIEFMSLFIKELFIQKQDIFSRIKAIKVFWKYYNEQIQKSIAIKKLLENLHNDASSILLYDFWFTNNALAIALSKDLYPDVRYIACTHNFDLYDFRWRCPIPFRGITMQKSDKIFPDSQYGVEYLKSRVPKSLHSKIELAYMGTPDFGMSPIPKESKVRILSTSSCIQHKRVDWIIEAIANLRDIEFEWIHFGDGPICDQLKKKAQELLPFNSFKFLGWVDFDELIKFYKETPIDVFVHMSEAEGLPVSLMIASSFGIPIVAVDSMGIPELVNSTTGYLLPSNCTVDDATKAIEDIVHSLSRSTKARIKVREFCMKNFSLENYKIFYDIKIKNLNN